MSLDFTMHINYFALEALTTEKQTIYRMIKIGRTICSCKLATQAHRPLCCSSSLYHCFPAHFLIIIFFGSTSMKQGIVRWSTSGTKLPRRASRLTHLSVRARAFLARSFLALLPRSPCFLLIDSALVGVSTASLTSYSLPYLLWTSLLSSDLTQSKHYLHFTLFIISLDYLKSCLQSPCSPPGKRLSKPRLMLKRRHLRSQRHAQLFLWCKGEWENRWHKVTNL